VANFTKARQRAKYEIQRRDLLKVLLDDFGHFVSVEVLGNTLDLLDHAMSDEDVRFHLQYLADLGFIELVRKDDPETRRRNVIQGARLRNAGVDFLDGRNAGEPGVARG